MCRQRLPPAAAQGARGRLDRWAVAAGPHQPNPEALLDAFHRLNRSLAHPAEAEKIGFIFEGDETVQHGRGLGSGELRVEVLPRRDLLLDQVRLQISSTTPTETASDSANAAPNAKTFLGHDFHVAAPHALQRDGSKPVPLMLGDRTCAMLHSSLSLTSRHT
jgi:hypothetical protein